MDQNQSHPRPSVIGYLFRFLIGSSLIMTAGAFLFTAPVTLVGLPLGVILLGAGLELMTNGGKVRARRQASGNVGQRHDHSPGRTAGDGVDGPILDLPGGEGVRRAPERPKAA